jgi:hypothetical protein
MRKQRGYSPLRLLLLRLAAPLGSLDSEPEEAYLMRSILIGLAGCAVLSSAAAQAQDQPTAAPANASVCARIDAALPAEMIGWTHRLALPGAVKVAGLTGSTLALGKGVDAILPMTGKIAYLARPRKPDSPKNHGGLFQFAIDREGAYAIALGGTARIDLLRDRAAVAPVSRVDGPSCSTIRKVIDFRLTPGTYVLQVSAYADAKLPLMVTRRP